jgi:hypothetical protein
MYDFLLYDQAVKVRFTYYKRRSAFAHPLKKKQPYILQVTSGLILVHVV